MELSFMKRTLLMTLVCALGIGQVAAGQDGGAERESGSKNHLYLVSNAHLDTQWKWTVRQTIGEFLPNTLQQNFRLFELYPDYVFNFEGAVKYSLMKEYYPQDFEKLKEYVREGRWRISGSSWEASDVIVPSSESFFRNILLGQELYRKEFGVPSKDIMLPDCFGFSANLPTIASHCGLLGFSTQKLGWRYANFHGDSKWPFEFGVWEGIDGSKILAVAHGYKYSWNPDRDFSRDESILKSIDESPIGVAFRYYGTKSSQLQGDRGGSPTPLGVEYVMKSRENSSCFDILPAGSDDIFRDWAHLLDTDVLPSYSGELLMDTHGAGCYTSQARMKRMNRDNELAAGIAEGAAVIADWMGCARYPHYQLSDAWKRFLWHQFHDDLTGTSIPEVYDISRVDEMISLNQFHNVIESSLESISHQMDTRVKGVPVVVFNPVAVKNEDYFNVTLPLGNGITDYIAYDSKGKKVTSEVLRRDESSVTLAVAATSEAMSVEVFDFRGTSAARRTAVPANERTVENAIWKVTVNQRGDICSIVDKRCDRELVRKGDAFSLDIFEHNVSDQWPGWEIYKSTLDSEPVSASEDVRIEMESRNVLRSVLKVTRRYNNTSIVQRIILYNAGPVGRIDIENTIDWKEEGKLMKASFPLGIASEKATYDIGLGNVRRGNNSETAYEVYAHQWADLTAEDGSYGVTILTNGKYGWDKPDNNTLRLTLFHSPSANKDRYVEHRTQDWGEHIVRYSILGHISSLDEAAAAAAADRMAYRKVAVPVSVHAGSMGRNLRMLKVSNPSLMVRCFKKAENGDGFIVRLYESSGSIAEGTVEFASEILSAEKVNGLEEKLEDAEIEGRKLKVRAGAYSPATFRVRLCGNDRRSVRETVSVSLPYDVVAITSDAFTSIGKMDRSWRSYSAETIPDSLLYRGIPFVFGKADFPNALACKGQKIILPQSYSKVCFLAASSDRTRSAEFVSGSITRTFEVPVWTGLTAPLDGTWMLSEAQIACSGSHRHHPSTRNQIYEPTYIYMFEMPVEGSALTLPFDENIRILSMTAVEGE